jgi:hypothetical protein
VSVRLCDTVRELHERVHQGSGNVLGVAFADSAVLPDFRVLATSRTGAPTVAPIIVVGSSLASVVACYEFLQFACVTDVIIDDVEPFWPLVSAHTLAPRLAPCCTESIRLLAGRWGGAATDVIGVAVGSGFVRVSSHTISSSLAIHRTTLQRRLLRQGVRSVSRVVRAARATVALVCVARQQARWSEALRVAGVHEARARRRYRPLMATSESSMFRRLAPSASGAALDEAALAAMDRFVMVRQGEWSANGLDG